MNPAQPGDPALVAGDDAAPRASAALRRAARVLDVTTLVAVFLAYSPCLAGGYLLDDRVYLSENALLARVPAGEPWRVFVQPTNPWEYLPLRDLSYLLDLHVGRLSPAFSHAVQLLLYVLCCLAARGLARRLFDATTALEAGSARTDLAASLVMAVFALHPAHAESVAWIAGRKDLLSGLFVCLSLSGVAVATFGTRVHGPMALATLAFVAALLSKSNSAVAPLLALAVLAAAPRVWEDRSVIRRTAPWLLGWFLLAAASVTLASIVAEATGVAGGDLPPDDRWIPLRILGRLVTLVFVPYPLALHHDVGGIPMAILGTGTAALGVFFVARLVSGRARLVDLAYVLLVVPVLPVLQLVPFRTWSLASDRFVFLAILGPAMVLGHVASDLLGSQTTPSRTKKAVAAIAALVLGLGGWVIHGRASEMRSVRILLRAEVERRPSSLDALDVYTSEILLPERRYDEALERASRLPPSADRRLLVAYVVAERALARRDPAEMERASRALAVAGPSSPKPLRTLARLEEALGHVDAALAAYYAASRADRHFEVDLREARVRLVPDLEAARRASAAAPTDPSARLALIELSLRAYDLEEADRQLRMLVASPLAPELEPRTRAAIERIRELSSR